ncbi:MAG TPA: glucokinase [Thermoanaerobaculia bacterium]|nr:glucokinase [Thermoanaerobaculia bacterium]
MRIIAGDVGGTKTLLECVDLRSGRQIVAQERYESGRWSTFDLLLADFIRRCPTPIDAACFAVAGPVLEDRAEITNLQWRMDRQDLSRTFAIPRIALINDFYAVALGVPLLQPEDLLQLHSASRVRGAPIAILGAGTGLGEANVFFIGDEWHVVPSEGGHADFAPQDEEQSRLFLALLQKHGHVSWERLLSGMGIANIFNFLTGGTREYDESYPGEIAALAVLGDPHARRTFEIFVDIYGAEAGNMALRLLARGGVFLAGGVAAKNTAYFTDGRFVESFLRKGRFRAFLESIPVDLITNPNVGLIGAAEMARRVAAIES